MQGFDSDYGEEGEDDVGGGCCDDKGCDEPQRKKAKGSENASSVD